MTTISIGRDQMSFKSEKGHVIVNFTDQPVQEVKILDSDGIVVGLEYIGLMSTLSEIVRKRL